MNIRRVYQGDNTLQTEIQGPGDDRFTYRTRD